MSDEIYNAVGEIIHSITEEYFTQSGRFRFSQPRSQENYNVVHAAMTKILNDEVARFGVTVEEFIDECSRRLSEV